MATTSQYVGLASHNARANLPALVAASRGAVLPVGTLKALESPPLPVLPLAEPSVVPSRSPVEVTHR